MTLYIGQDHSSLQTSTDIVLNLVDQLHPWLQNLHHVLHCLEIQIFASRMPDNWVRVSIHSRVGREDSLKIQVEGCCATKQSLHEDVRTFGGQSRGRRVEEHSVLGEAESQWCCFCLHEGQWTEVEFPQGSEVALSKSLQVRDIVLFSLKKQVLKLATWRKRKSREAKASMSRIQFPSLLKHADLDRGFAGRENGLNGYSAKFFEMSPTLKSNQHLRTLKEWIFKD